MKNEFCRNFCGVVRVFFANERGANQSHPAPVNQWKVLGLSTEHARLIVSQIVLDTFDELKMAYPKTRQT